MRQRNAAGLAVSAIGRSFGSVAGLSTGGLEVELALVRQQITALETEMRRIEPNIQRFEEERRHKEHALAVNAGQLSTFACVR
ncbi:hypothetical protein [Pseudohoeflea coraliihabitans]|uniref:Uncharacterized protein n=1 Tax=Pseudohoeflea coraliihabitans TaxID=2860393 RepID=A0ABS6WKA9_9HYPH|nr:hypothetical protein [Pseudohoeflea sp. DP4N28-3]MBW3096215.1 hypothetical protein [Pseudohoeflea sp. DP4N28-3]